MAVTSVSASAFLGSWSTSIAGDEHALLQAKAAPPHVRAVGRPLRSMPMMKNINEGKGVFAPIVVLTRNIVGKKRFNQLRGKAIALHSQVIIFQLELLDVTVFSHHVMELSNAYSMDV